MYGSVSKGRKIVNRRKLVRRLIFIAVSTILLALYSHTIVSIFSEGERLHRIKDESTRLFSSKIFLNKSCTSFRNLKDILNIFFSQEVMSSV
ncbi:hypothetical protein RB195_016853 [Necator americanus]|uniref:Uncharacterized protein n=1 Tax=Necator americanus TaxID=51031 RepID=A0ABR1C2G8_NECAM